MAINEKSEKFWYGVKDKVTMEEYGGWWSMGKNGENIENLREYGRVYMGGIREYLVVLGVESSKGEHGRNGKMLGKSWEMCVGVCRRLW